MIELPDKPAPNGVNPVYVDNGFTQPGPSGPAGRIDRPGNHYRVEVSFPPMPADVARRFVARLQKAKREGLRIPFPLLGIGQGVPGSPVVDGANPTGTSLPVRGLTPHYAVKEGYWLHIEDADGQRYLHSVQANGVADVTGDLTITIEPPIRAPLADGSTVELAKPTVEGILVEEFGWSLPASQLVRFGAAIVIEEEA